MFATIDRNRDGEIDAEEADDYAASVLGSTSLAVDDRPTGITLTGRRFPSFEEMTQGAPGPTYLRPDGSPTHW